MDSRESLQPPQPPQHHQVPPPHSQSLMMAPPPQQSQHPNSYNNNNNNNNNSINPNSITATMMQQQQQQNSRFPFNSDILNSQYGGDGSSPSSAGGFRAGGFSIEPARKKRGRPRKYSPSPDGNNIALGLAPAPITPISSVGGHVDSSDGGNNPMSEPSAKKARGRPAGSGKKQLDALGSPGVGFTPHVITVKTGEDSLEDHGLLTARTSYCLYSICKWCHLQRYSPPTSNVWWHRDIRGPI